MFLIVNDRTVRTFDKQRSPKTKLRFNLNIKSLQPRIEKSQTRLLFVFVFALKKIISLPNDLLEPQPSLPGDKQINTCYFWTSFSPSHCDSCLEWPDRVTFCCVCVWWRIPSGGVQKGHQSARLCEREDSGGVFLAWCLLFGSGFWILFVSF